MAPAGRRSGKASDEVEVDEERLRRVGGPSSGSRWGAVAVGAVRGTVEGAGTMREDVGGGWRGGTGRWPVSPDPIWIGGERER